MKGKALSGALRLEEEVWATFSCDLKRLNSVSTAIRKAVEICDACLECNMDDIEQEAHEGKVLTRLHLFRERS